MKIHRWLKRNSSFYAKYYRQIAAIAVGIVTAGAASAALTAAGWASTAITTKVAVGAIAGFAGGFVATGSLKGALIGGLTGAAFAGVGAFFKNPTGLASKWGLVKEVGHIASAGKVVATKELNSPIVMDQEIS